MGEKLSSRIPLDASSWSSLLSGPFVLKPAEYIALARQASCAPSGALPPHRRIRLAFLSNLTLHFLDPYLKVEGLRRGLLPDNYFGPFGQFEQAILAEDSALKAHNPDILFLQISLEALDPDFFARYLTVSSSEAETYFSDLKVRVARLVYSWREISSAPLVVFNFVPPVSGPRGIFEASDPASLLYRVSDLNHDLARVAAQFAQTYVFDYLGLVRNHGTRQWLDPKMWYIGRIATGASGQIAMAKSLLRLAAALSCPPAKCLVLDLDNTLWGGAVGDDGVAGIQLGDDFPGNMFKDFQRYLIRLRDSGFLLAINSKNDLASVEEAFSHPDMILKWDDFSAARVNWIPKAVNMDDIAKELNIGLDSMAFFDDNPVEREQMRQQCPEVRVIDVPESAACYVDALQACPWFDISSITGEDRERSHLYRQERLRQMSRSKFASIEDFLKDLQMIGQVGRLRDETFERVAQLIAKTNQFNLTSRRHAPGRLREMMSDPRFLIFWMRLRDRFGDQGLVVVGILQEMAEESSALIETFLMSCRVMGRNVEAAFLAYILKQAMTVWGCRKILGEYRPTAKNTPVIDFYPGHGFRLRDQTPNSIIYEINDPNLPFPPEISVEEVSS